MIEGPVHIVFSERWEIVQQAVRKFPPDQFPAEMLAFALNALEPPEFQTFLVDAVWRYFAKVNMG